MQIDRKRATIKLAEAGILVEDQKISKADMPRALEVLAAYKAEAESPDVVAFIKALGKLRWDTINEAEAVKQFKEFFRAGNIPEFYVHTLEEYLGVAQKAQKEYNDEQSKKMVMIKDRAKKDKQENKEA